MGARWGETGGRVVGGVSSRQGSATMAKRTQDSPQRVRSAAAGSWIALLAATTLGGAADTLHAEVRADGLAEEKPYRLVVQSYDESDGSVPGRYARPGGSMQRAGT